MARPRPDNLRADQVQTIKLPSGNALDRVHPAIYPGDQFNPSPSGDARFSPLIEGGMVVPTLYAGESLDCALMETLFHDVPYTDGPKRVRVKKINPLAHSSLRTLQEIEFADLSNIALRKLRPAAQRSHRYDCRPICAITRMGACDSPGASGRSGTRVDLETT